MTTELSLLAATAASVGLAHTLLGPDHYLPFILMARAQKWPWPKTAGLTLLCGLGHVGSSILLGVLGLAFGFYVLHLEKLRGDLAAWLLMALGMAYMVWGLRRAWRSRPHAHAHEHGDGQVHVHAHVHAHAHLHLHPRPGRRFNPWVLFIIFVLGPCEPLIPLLLMPAARKSWAALVTVAGAFSAATLTAMLAAVLLSALGFQRLSFGRLDRYVHAFSGAAILLCGAGMAFLGL